MSSTDQIELVRRFQDAWFSKDLDTVLDCIHPDMEFDWSESRAPFRGIYREFASGKLFQTTEEALEAARRSP